MRACYILNIQLKLTARKVKTWCNCSEFNQVKFAQPADSVTHLV